jgi:hypothetical protein
VRPGDLDLDSDVDVVGVGAAVTVIDGDGTDRVFDVGPTASVDARLL